MAFVDRQIMSSNTILLNKCDLVDINEQNNIANTFKELNSDAKIEFTNYCEFDYTSMDFQEFRLAGDAESCNTRKSAPKRVNLEQLDFKKTDFVSFLNSIIKLTWRIKGFYRLENKHYYFSNNNSVMEVSNIDENKLLVLTSTRELFNQTHYGRSSTTR